MPSDLQEIDGIGNTTENKLLEAGINSINDLANSTLSELEAIGVRSPQKILDRARQRGVQIKGGERVAKEEANATLISTGMQELDGILGGGLQGGFLVGVSGESKAGKTQLALQCLSSAADFHGNAIYIETEPNRFSIERVKQMTVHDDSYKNVYMIEGHADDDDPIDGVDMQYNAYESIRDTFDEVSIIVVDSFIANFRLSGKYQSRADLPERNSDIAKHLKTLQSMSKELDCPILMTLQVQGNPEKYGGNYSIWGPVLMDHTITHLLHMKHAKGELKEALLKGHPSLPDDSVLLKIPENGRLEVKG